MNRLQCVSLMLSFFLGAAFAAPINPEIATQNYFETIKHDPKKLNVFLLHMPKGADLHSHLAGASLAENMINYGKQDGLCVDTKTYIVGVNASCIISNRLATAQQYPNLYNAMIDAWSMRNFVPGKETGHDHFFSAFAKFNKISNVHDNQILSEVIDRAGQQNVAYVELMITPDRQASSQLGKKLGWDTNLTRFRKTLLNNGLVQIVKQISFDLDVKDKALTHALQCSTSTPLPGCRVNVRYLYQVLREQPPEQVFAQLLTGFEIASKDQRVVGINIVQPEDGKIAMRDYKLQMAMIGFLHQLYPNVNISLHAGELIPGLVPAEGLRFHIREAVNTAHAERIGHGVSIAYEANSKQLLKEMAKKQVMVEINLTSNAAILNVEGKKHPLLLYMQYGVPVALSTDDEGILRTNLTNEYERAVKTYGFSYATMKKLSRNSLNYSFLPGKGIWQTNQYRAVVPACAKDALGAKTVAATCQAFLDKNEKARLQWDLEGRFAKFEKESMIN